MEENKNKENEEAKVVSLDQSQVTPEVEVKTDEVPVETKPQDFHLPIHVKKEGQGWLAQMVDGEVTWKGEGDGPLDAVRSMLNHIEVHNIKEEKLKVRRFMQLNFDSAKSLVIQIMEILGPEFAKSWFTVYQLTVKTGQVKEQLEARLRTLSQYGLIQLEKPKGPGNRYKIVYSLELQKEILTRKLQAAKDEAEQLEFQLSNLLLNEPKPVTTETKSE